MNNYIIGLSLITLLCYYSFYRSRILSLKNSGLNRFKKKFKNRNRIKDKLVENYSDLLMSNPEEDIKISIWNTEKEVHEKADIHRARLNKYGRSKLNGEILFLGPKGGVYKYTKAGNKQYL